MPTDPRAAVQAAVLDLLRSLAGQSLPPTIRVTEAAGGLACMVVVWEAGRLMPTLVTERRTRDKGQRVGCRRDVLDVVRAAGVPLTRKQVVKAIREGKKGHGPGTVAKALAELTASGELVNARDKKGYRLADWPKRPRTPSLFA